MRSPTIHHAVLQNNTNLIKGSSGKENPQASRPLARKPAASNLNSLTGSPAMSATSAAQVKLVSVDIKKLHSTSSPADSLLERKTFDKHSADLTRQAYKAVLNAYDAGTEYFFIPRNPANTQFHSADSHANFRKVRIAAQQSAKGGKDHTDVSTHKDYKKLSNPRINGAKSTTNVDGKSPLEKHLPANSRFRSLLEPGTGGIRDVRTGLHATLSQDANGKTYTLVFPGTGAVDTESVQWALNVKQFMGFGGVPAAYQDAEKLVATLKASLPKGATLNLAGHSLGGGIAAYAGLMHKVETVGFNSAALGPACMKELKKRNALTPEHRAKINQVRFKGDAVSSPKVQLTLTALLNFGWLLPDRVPKLIGVAHEIPFDDPKRPQSVLDRHLAEGFEKYYD